LSDIIAWFYRRWYTVRSRTSEYHYKATRFAWSIDMANSFDVNDRARNRRRRTDT